MITRVATASMLAVGFLAGTAAGAGARIPDGAVDLAGLAEPLPAIVRILPACAMGDEPTFDRSLGHYYCRSRHGLGSRRGEGTAPWTSEVAYRQPAV
jgi:hypothetical protein